MCGGSGSDITAVPKPAVNISGGDRVPRQTVLCPPRVADEVRRRGRRRPRHISAAYERE